MKAFRSISEAPRRRGSLLALVLAAGWVSALTAPAVPLYTLDNPPGTPALGDLPLQGSVSRHGITWTFAEPARVGQFVNGDYYIVGPVTVTAISPAPAGGRHGSVLNLPPVHNKSGFDSRVSANRYDASLRSDPPIAMQPGDSLTSSISVDTVGTIKRVLRTSDDTISPVKSVSVLTCLASPAPPDAFRPSYCDTSNTLYYSRYLDRDILPGLPAVSGTPSLSEYEGYFQRPWIDLVEFQFDAPVEYMPDYAREIARAVSMAGLLLMLDFTQEEKEALLVYLVQYGIDLYGAIQAGYEGWEAHGGHGSGRKLPILLAGVLLGEPGMQQPDAEFGEDMQTIYGQGWTGATALYGGHRGSEYAPGSLYGPHEHLQPSEWPTSGGKLLGEDYRRCCTSIAWVGQALVARLINAVNTWNHPAFFDYVDRWMTEDDSSHVDTIQQQTGKSYHAGWMRQGQAWDSFVENMWAAYRSLPTNQVAEYFWIEAEEGALSSPVTTDDDPAASRGRFIYSTASEQGTAEFTFQVQGGTYMVWAHAAAGEANPAGSDSFHVSIDGGAEDAWDLFYDLPGGPATDWTWDPVSLRCGGNWTNNLCDPALFTLAPGTHVLTLRGREPNTRIDKILITSDLSYDLSGEASCPDADRDQLPDEWETAELGGMDGEGAGNADDPDRDGLTNWQEFVAGSQPTNTTSFPRLAMGHSNGEPTVTFFAPEASGSAYDGLSRYYALQRCGDLGSVAPDGTNGWEDVAGYESILATNQVVVYNLPSSGVEGATCFRSLVRLAP